MLTSTCLRFALLQHASLAVLLIFATACGDDDNPGPVDLGAVDASTVAFGQVFDTVIGDTCGIPGCHQGARPAGALDMSTADIAFMNLVNTDAGGPACVGRGVRVIPGDPDMSILFSKISETDPICGGRMPAQGPALNETQLELFRRWIAGGANR